MPKLLTNARADGLQQTSRAKQEGIYWTLTFKGHSFVLELVTSFGILWFCVKQKGTTLKTYVMQHTQYFGEQIHE